jgi:hypothetical protein
MQIDMLSLMSFEERLDNNNIHKARMRNYLFTNSCPWEAFLQSCMVRSLCSWLSNLHIM